MENKPQNGYCFSFLLTLIFQLLYPSGFGHKHKKLWRKATITH